MLWQSSMASARTKRAKGNALTCILWLGSVFLLALAPATLAQGQDPGAIRVQSNDVIVPVLVFDKGRLADVQQLDSSALWRLTWTNDFRTFQKVAVTGLAKGDFSVFEDGQRQNIESFEPELQGDSPVLTDNLGQYREITGIGGGTWAIPLWEMAYPHARVVEGPPLSGYVLTYAPPSSPDGSCHHIKLTVDRPDSLVLARSEYCNTRQSPADPLKGTKLGEQMQADSRVLKESKIAISLAAIPLLTKEGKTRLRIVLDYSSKFMDVNCKKTKMVAIRGVMYGNDGVAVMTFSDLTERNKGHTFANSKAWALFAYGAGTRCRVLAPFRYEAQMEVPPGKYELRVGLMDVNKLGEAEVPVTVDSYQGTQLEVSGIVIAKRFRASYTLASPTELPGGTPPLVAKGIQVTPSADTHFKKGEPFYFYFQVYEPQSSGTAEPKVEAHLRIVDATTSKLMTELDPDTAYYRTPGAPLFPVIGTIDVGALPSGSYQFQLQATDSAGNVTPWHTADFTVE